MLGQKKAVVSVQGRAGRLSLPQRGIFFIMNDVLIDIRDLVVEFDGERILNGLNLQIRDKEFVHLFGPFRLLGKPQPMRIIGGFIEPRRGDVYFDGRRINDLPALQTGGEYCLSAVCPLSSPQCL